MIFVKLNMFLKIYINKTKNKSITHKIFRIKSHDFFMCGIYCIAFIEYSIAANNLLEYTNLFSSNDYQKNNKIIYMCFKIKHGDNFELHSG